MTEAQLLAAVLDLAGSPLTQGVSQRRLRVHPSPTNDEQDDASNQEYGRDGYGRRLTGVDALAGLDGAELVGKANHCDRCQDDAADHEPVSARSVRFFGQFVLGVRHLESLHPALRLKTPRGAVRRMGGGGVAISRRRGDDIPALRDLRRGSGARARLHTHARKVGGWVRRLTRRGSAVRRPVSREKNLSRVKRAKDVAAKRISRDGRRGFGPDPAISRSLWRITRSPATVIRSL